MGNILLGLANKKSVTIQSGGKDQSVVLATTKTKKQNKPATLLNKSVMKKEFRRMAKAVTNQVTNNQDLCKIISVFNHQNLYIHDGIAVAYVC